jgi:hypothetical protein
MAKKQNVVETPNTGATKFEQIIDHGDIIQIWKYDRKFSKNAYEVENIYKGDPKFLKLKKGVK